MGHPFPQASLAQYPEGALQREVPSEGKSSGIVTRFPRLLEHHTQVLLPFQPPRDRQKPRLTEAAGFPGGSDGKESACSAGDLDLILGSGRSPGEGNGNPLQYFCLENPMDRGAWRAAVHGLQRVRHD